MSIQRLSNSGQSGYRYKTLIAGITPVASIPVIGEATALTYSTASVAFTTPGAYAGSTYTATSSPGGFTGTSASSPITVSGLSDNTAYTFTVTATNATGTSSPSAPSTSITTPSAFTPEGSYDALATVTAPSGGLASISFVGIPAGYKHLQLRGILRTNDSGSWNNQQMLFNSDTGSNYKSHYLFADGSSATAGAVAGSTSFNDFMRAASNSLTAGIFGAAVIDILDYSTTNKYKTFRAVQGGDSNGAGMVGLVSGVWMSTSAITSITINPSGGTAIQYSSFALYGVK